MPGDLLRVAYRQLDGLLVGGRDASMTAWIALYHLECNKAEVFALIRESGNPNNYEDFSII